MFSRYTLCLQHICTLNRICRARINNRLYSSKPLTDHQRELMGRSLPKRMPIAGVQHIVVVASGKGGVGKSTTSSNLAVQLAQMGHRVGLLDADIFGPSIPLMMNVHETPLVDDRNLMIPPVNFNVKCLSMGLLVDADKPVVWRGPLVMSALQRMLRGAIWSPLDVLIVDTPPGTGDIHISLAQNVPLAGVLLVSTPQKAALDVTRRGAEMYSTMQVPLIGMVENMRDVLCSNCGSTVALYPGSLGAEFCAQMGVDLLGSFPIEPHVVSCCDTGTPIVLQRPDSAYAQTMRGVAEKIGRFLKLEVARSDGDF